MNKNKLETITNLFENKEIRSLWDVEKEEYYFSVVDVINALTDSPNPRKYWSVLKGRLKNEGSQLTTKCSQLKLMSKDGKYYNQDVLDTEGIFRLIESVPSPHAEPFKMWLATLGKERIDEVYDPEITVNRAISYYRNHGYSDEWIKSRLIGILDRHKLTDVWKENGINENYEYAILTNEIYKTWSGMKTSEYKEFKGIRKESLRDNMTEVEVALTNLGEIATKEIAKAQKPYGLEQNKKVAHKGGTIAKNAKESIEKETGMPVVSKTNSLNYQYIDELKQINEDNNKITN
ncbi:MAG: Bro-N domain-containing protein [Bacilli bacterium]